MPKIVFTGHRPKHIGGSGYLKSPIGLWVKAQLKQTITDAKCDEGVVGGARGTDTIAAFCCMEMKVPYRVFLPFHGYQEKWNTIDKVMLDHILVMAKEVIYTYLAPPPNEEWKVFKLMHERNKAMVDYVSKTKEAMMVSVYNGNEGGTHNCIGYAAKAYPKMPIKNINPYDFKPTSLINIM